MARHRETTRTLCLGNPSLCSDTCALMGKAMSNEGTPIGLLLKISRCMLYRSSQNRCDRVAERPNDKRMAKLPSLGLGLQLWIADIRTWACAIRIWKSLANGYGDLAGCHAGHFLFPPKSSLWGSHFRPRPSSITIYPTKAGTRF